MRSRIICSLVMLGCAFGGSAATADPVVRAPEPLGDPPRAPRALRINEVDYDQPGFDTGEFVEIVNTGERRLRLRGTALALVNGTTSSEYRRVQLTGRLGPNRILVIATTSVDVATRAKAIAMPLARDNVQNGAPDAIALVHPGRGVLIDSLSYEGAIEAASFADLPGVWDLVRGDPVTEIDTNDDPGSLCRIPHAVDTGDDDHDWHACSPTPGAANEAA